MSTILYLAHTEEDGLLAKPALEGLHAVSLVAEGLGGTVAVGLVGHHVQNAANSIAGCITDKCYAVTGEAFAKSCYATDAKACTALCEAAEADIVLAPATARFSRCLAGVAARLKGRIDTFCTGLKVENNQVFINRWYYRQRMESTQTRTHKPWIITLAPSAFEPVSNCEGSIEITSVTTDTSTRTQVLGIEAPGTDEQTIRPDAAMLFVAGAGWTKKQDDGAAHLPEAEKHILDFLTASKSSLGSSKSLVDISGDGEAVLSFMTHLHQVGQTGSTPRHTKGLATCCHGEEPHVVGWRFISQRRAINLDAGCGWAQGKADVLYVADAFAVMEKVNQLLNK